MYRVNCVCIKMHLFICRKECLVEHLHLTDLPVCTASLREISVGSTIQSKQSKRVYVVCIITGSTYS